MEKMKIGQPAVRKVVHHDEEIEGDGTNSQSLPKNWPQGNMIWTHDWSGISVKDRTKQSRFASFTLEGTELVIRKNEKGAPVRVNIKGKLPQLKPDTILDPVTGVDGAVWHFGLRYTYVSDQEKNPTLIAYIEIVGKLLVVKTRTHEHRFCIDGDEIVALKPKMLNGHNCHSGI